jgi:large subunit ribosomal protein L34
MTSRRTVAVSRCAHRRKPGNCAIDTLPGVGMFSHSIRGFAAARGGCFPHKTRNRQRDLRNDMKRQYQPSKIRRKRQHGFLNRNSSKSGRATLRNRRRVGRRRLTPV